MAVYVDSTQILSKSSPPAFFSYPFSYSAPSGINLLRLIGFFPQTIGAPPGDINAYYYLGINSLTWSTQQNNLDLSIGEISIPAASIEADDNISLSPEKEFLVNIPISGSGFNSPETRSTSIYLKVGPQILQKTIALSELATSGKIASFSVTVNADDVGDQNITAIIDPFNKLGESNRQNNITSEFIHVLCKVSDQGTEVPWYYQSQTPWGADIYANKAPKKMKNLGCLVTSLSMLLNSYGIKTSTNGYGIDPGVLNKGLKETLFPELGPKYSSYSGYTAGGDVQPNGVVAYARNSYFMECVKNTGNVDSCLTESKRKISFKGSSNNFSESTRKIINKELCLGNPVILRVPSISSPNDSSKAHFVLATGMTVDTDGNPQYFTNDPGSSNGQDAPRLANSTNIKGYRLYKPTDDPSMIFFHLSGNVNMVVTDPQGRRSGYNPFTQQSYEEIPGGVYISPEAISDPEDASISSDTESRFEGMAPLAGQYQVQIYANGATNYRLTQYSYDTTGTINGIKDENGSIAANNSVIISVTHSDQSIPVKMASLEISKALFFDTNHKDMAFISGKIITTDGQSIASIEKYLQIKIGTFFRSIDKRNLKKFKHHGQIIYLYGSFGKKGLFLKLNATTGEFNIFVGNAELDSGDTNITADVIIQIDDLIAKGLVNFKNIRKTKNHGK